WRKDFYVAGGERDSAHEQQGRDGDPHVTSLTHFNEQGGPETKGDDRQQLIRESEKRPKCINSAERIDDTLIQEPTPSCDQQHARHKICHPGASVAKRSPQIPQQILQQKSAYSCPGIERRENEQGLKHDGE